MGRKWREREGSEGEGGVKRKGREWRRRGESEGEGREEKGRKYRAPFY